MTKISPLEGLQGRKKEFLPWDLKGELLPWGSQREGGVYYQNLTPPPILGRFVSFLKGGLKF
jgi:hypothetical protein